MSREVEITSRLLAELFPERALRDIRVRLWEGTYWPDDAPRRATIILKHPGALRRMFLPGTEVGLAEAYLFDDFDIDGEVEAIFSLREELASLDDGLIAHLKTAWDLLRLPREPRSKTTARGRAELHGDRHSIERDRQAISYHYDVSNDFYRLWLDERMVYSCAYFQTPEDSLEQAQAQKLEHICRKLRLRPGQRLLDIGCGWGGLVIYAAEHFGVEAVGITLSEAQVELAQDRIREAGLGDRCRVELRDYRQVVEPEGFDALASGGMFEHVGEARLPDYFQQAWKLLKPGGPFLNHGITRRATDPPEPPGSFSGTYVFPDGELTPISTSLRVAVGIGFEVRDVESLREHYALTLRRWVRRLEARHAEALRHVDEPTYRVWRLFMSGSAYGFSHGLLNLHQSLLIKPSAAGKSALPLTRQDWYEQRSQVRPAPLRQ